MFFCLIQIFVSSMCRRERFRGSSTNGPAYHREFFLQTWKTSWISDSAPDFSDEMNVWKIGQFPGHHFTSQTVFPALHGGLFIPDLSLVWSLAVVSVWSTLIGRGMSRLVSHWSRASLAMLVPAVLCHKESARAPIICNTRTFPCMEANYPL